METVTAAGVTAGADPRRLVGPASDEGAARSVPSASWSPDGHGSGCGLGDSHAVGLLERGVTLSREWNLTLFSVGNTGSLSYAHALSGRVAEGIPLLEHAVSAVETMGFGAYQPLFLMYLGEAYVLADRLEDGLEVAGRALTLARKRGQRGYEAWALRLLGEVTAHRDPPGHADGHYRDALALAEELGMRPLIAHCHLGLGKLDRRPGYRQQAQEHLTTATAMYREMEMPFWLDQAMETGGRA